MAKGSEQRALDCLEARVEHQYLHTKRNVLYDHGELDLTGLCSDGSWDVYEVKHLKRADTEKKAKRQLDRAKRLIPIIGDTYIYYFMENTIEKYE